MRAVLERSGIVSWMKDVLAPALSSSNRAKSHLRGKTLKSRTLAIDAFACNEVRLLITCLAYQAMHIFRRATAKATFVSIASPPPRIRIMQQLAQPDYFL